MKLSAGKALLLWLLAMIAGVAWITQTRFTADMSFFLPADPSPQQQVLVGQMKDGAVSRLLMVGIEGADETARSRASTALRQAMVDGGHFLSVQNGEVAALQAEREFLLRHRYHLSPAVTAQRFTSEGLQEAISRTIDVASSPVGYLFKPYLLQDPTGEMIEILSRLHPGTEPETRQGVWVSRDGQRALLLAQTRASGADTDGQEQAIEAVKSAFAGLQGDPSLQGMSLAISGPGQFAVKARESIRDEI
ncbi:MAG: hypothetical protein ACLGG8_06180, partial [Gammaproteobacteria bacterium]